jgi:hypothetical protein
VLSWIYLTFSFECRCVDFNQTELSLQTLRVPLSLKYSCPSESTWKLAVASLLKVLSIGLPVARQHASSGKFDSMWPELASTLEDFLFTKRSGHWSKMEREPLRRWETMSATVQMGVLLSLH